VFLLGGNVKHGRHPFGKVGGFIQPRLGKRMKARRGPLDVMGDHQKVGRVARKAINWPESKPRRP
jgi:hypothetical protein